MTKPKEHHPGQLVEISRRTTQRCFFWNPGKATRELFGYMFGKAAIDHDQLPHVACLMSNHPHMLVTDRSGFRSDFMRQMFSNSARKRNLQIDRRENLWAPGELGDMTVLDLEETIERVLYVCLQAVAAGCVERAEEWTGFQILPRHWGKKMRFKRPDLCGPDMPEFVEFVPMPPPGFDHLPLHQVIDFFEDLIAREEARYAKARKGPVLGISVCEAMSPFHTPNTRTPMNKLNPRFCTSDPARAIKAIEHQRRFRGEHRARRLSFRGGDRNVVFPAGTLQMVRRNGVACRPCADQHPMALDVTWTAAVHAIWDDWLVRRAA